VTSVVGVDVGGTFTDCVAWDGTNVSRVKVPTTAEQSRAVVAGAAQLVTSGHAHSLLHGSTVATNALLERAGADTVLVTDSGFEDVIEIGRQDRPSLYDPFVDRPEPLVPRRCRLGLGADLAHLVEQVAELAPQAVAVSLAYSFADPSTERKVGAALGPLGVPISLSSSVAAEFREFERTSTTVLNAYLASVVGSYLRRLEERAAGVARRVQVMRSSGGLMGITEAAGLAAALLLSGPAGGVVAAAEMSRARGHRRIVTFDMGGTSTDVSRIEDGRPDVAYQRTVDGYVCRMPSVAVHTVGAGGGSIAWIDPGGSLRVGPNSAGADPGPASYGKGGVEATVTDAHLALGRIDPTSRLGGDLALDVEAGTAALRRVGEVMGLDGEATAQGIVDVVEAHMERAIRTVSVEQGVDPRDAVLVAFGGAGGLHATSLARKLSMASVEVPPFAGVLSALGLLMAPPRHDSARSVASGSDVESAVRRISEEATAAFRDSHGSAPATVERAVDMRYHGQAHEITVPLEPGDTIAEAAVRFHRLHREMNGFSRQDDPVETVTVRAAAQGKAHLGWADLPKIAEGPLPPPRIRPVVFGGRSVESAKWWRPDLPAGATVTGPAVVSEEVGTTVLAPGESAVVASDGTLEIRW
jgi:N-methylhydantoinase A